jgi:hypothetical protein
MIKNKFLKLALIGVTFTCVASFGVVFAQGEPTDIGVDWAGLFNADGSLRDNFDDQGAPGANGIADAIDVYGGMDAVFIEDRASGGAVIDISALQRATALADFYVYNGPVVAPHDVGNAYVFMRMDGVDLVLDVRVERTISGAGTGASYVEIELNQKMVGTRAGKFWPDQQTVPHEFRWTVRGRRSVGDLLVRLNLDGGTVSSVEFERWEDVGGSLGYNQFQTADNLGAEACFGEAPFFNSCSGSLSVDEGIANGDPEQIYDPDNFVELSVNLGQLLGSNPDFTTVQVCSPQDIGFGTFKATGRYAGH